MPGCWHCSPSWTGWHCWHCGREVAGQRVALEVCRHQAECPSTLADRAIAKDKGRYSALLMRRMVEDEEGMDQVDHHPELVVGPTGRIGRVYEDIPGGTLRVATSAEWVAVLGPWGSGKAPFFWNARNNCTQWKIPIDLTRQAVTY